MGKSATPRAAIKRLANREIYKAQLKVAKHRREHRLALQNAAR